MTTWSTTTIDEACNVEYGTRVVQKRDGGKIYPVYGGGGATFFMDTTNRANRVVVSRFGMSEECTRFVDGEFFLNDSGLTLSPMDTGALLPTFLDRLTLALNDKIFALGKGSAQKNLDVPAFRSLRITYPASLAEQRRIVAILDEALEGIATVKSNTEKNLRNARELYARYLQIVFSGRDEGCVERRLSDVAKEFGRGKSRHRPRNEPRLYGGPYPFIQTGDISGADHWLNDFTQTYSDLGLAQSCLWPAGTVCIAIVGATVGETAILSFDACFPDSVIGIVVDRVRADAEYVEYMLQSFKAVLKEKGQGTARDNINLGTFENQLFPFPPLDRQLELVRRLNSVRDEVHRLEEIAWRKISALEELKKTLLNHAFSGQLASSVRASTTQKLALQTATPEFTANVISLAYARHERQKRELTFGHVKEQKLLQLVESIAGIDLGRQPMRDAAGPNDFQHMLRAESWAKTNGFFDMVKRGEGYEFSKLSAFDEHMSRARQALAPYLSRLEPVIDLLVPMDTEEAEVFATVHAAWNNLLIDGVQATDDVIVSAAREGWHTDKLKIPEHKFRSAIEKIRQKKLIPDGSAKYVGGQQTLL